MYIFYGHNGGTVPRLCGRRMVTLFRVCFSIVTLPEKRYHEYVNDALRRSQLDKPDNLLCPLRSKRAPPSARVIAFWFRQFAVCPIWNFLVFFFHSAQCSFLSFLSIVQHSGHTTRSALNRVTKNNGMPLSIQAHEDYINIDLICMWRLLCVQMQVRERRSFAPTGNRTHH